MIVPTIRIEKGKITIIDQRLLPAEFKIASLAKVDELCYAIRSMRIRGAPALGLAGAFGLLLAVEERWGGVGGYFFDMDGERISSFPSSVGSELLLGVLEEARGKISSTRPTAVNLFWALERMRSVWASDFGSPADLLRALYQEAISIYQEDLDMCKAIGSNGASLLNDGDSIITHCNAGGLATSGYGTALGVVFAAVESGKKIHVYASETRPLLQGSRLSAWECVRRNIPVTVVCDGMAAYVMSRKLVSCAIVGADRIAVNGDTANKIGTLGLAVSAKHFGVPFLVAAPSSTIDPSVKNGSGIPLEERPENEVKTLAGLATAPEGAGVLNPAFDVTPCELISAIVTEKGIFYPPFEGLGAYASSRRRSHNS